MPSRRLWWINVVLDLLATPTTSLTTYQIPAIFRLMCMACIWFIHYATDDYLHSLARRRCRWLTFFFLFCCYWCRSLMPNTMCGGTMHTETTRMKQISYCYFINGSAFFWYFVYIDDHRPWREMASLLCLFFDTNTAKAVASTQLGLYEWITKHVYFRLWLNCAQCHYYITIPPEWEWAACKNKKTNKHQIPAEL